MNVEHIGRQLEEAEPREVIRWAWDTFGDDVVATSSFQTQSIPLLHMIAEEAPGIRVLFLNTGFHFPETLAFRDELVERFNLNIHVLVPRMGHENFQKEHGSLYRTDPDLCCYLNKVEPLELALSEHKAWIAGIRRDQTATRGGQPVLERQSNGLYKVCPIVTWTSRQIWSYIHEHDLPVHPLLEKGYMSIGCAPCTRPAYGEEGERSGRWVGREKVECGLHTVAKRDAQ